MNEQEKKTFRDLYDDCTPEAQERVQAILREYAISDRDLSDQEQDEAGDKVACIMAQDRRQREGKRKSLTGMLRILREAGWMVAVHNDYRQDGKLQTFWLFTHPSGKWLKGEAERDEDAVFLVFSKAALVS